MALWEQIDGYFTFPDFYEWVSIECNESRDNWRGVEVGVYTGQSAAFLVENMYSCSAPGIVQLDLVDIELTKHRARENLAPLMSKNIIGNFLEMSSVAASQMYTDKSLDFVFIDADHSYAAVGADIDAWLPKVRPGGIIAGHDYCEWPGFGVIQAVTERFERVQVWRGRRGMGDAQMQPRYWPCWSVWV